MLQTNWHFNSIFLFAEVCQVTGWWVSYVPISSSFASWFWIPLHLHPLGCKRPLRFFFSPLKIPADPNAASSSSSRAKPFDQYVNTLANVKLPHRLILHRLGTGCVLVSSLDCLIQTVVMFVSKMSVMSHLRFFQYSQPAYTEHFVQSTISRLQNCKDAGARWCCQTTAWLYLLSFGKSLVQKRRTVTSKWNADTNNRSLQWYSRYSAV